MEANPRDRWRRKRFTENLDRLLTDRGLTRKAAADKSGVPYQWLRRAVSKGIAWPDVRSKERLQKLADALGLKDVESLWGRDFIVPPEPSSIKDGAAELGELMRMYVMLVGVEDATLRGIVVQIREAVRAHRHPEYEQARRARLASKAEENPPPSQVAPQRLTIEERMTAVMRGMSAGERYTSRKRYSSRWANLASRAVENAPPPQEAKKGVKNAPPPQELPQRISGDEEILARTSARQLVAQVLNSLSPEQSEFFFLDYPSAAEAEKYVEDQFLSRIRGRRRDHNGRITAQSPEEALRAVIAEIVEDNGKASHSTGRSDSDHPFDEPITLEEKPLETRHGDDVTPEGTDDRGSLPEESDLEVEITRSPAVERAAVRHVDEILEHLGETPHPSGRGTYLESIKRLGNPMLIAEVAFRDAGGDIGKALEWLVGKVNKSIEDERAQADAMRQAKPPQGRMKAPATRRHSKKKGQPVEMSPEDFRRFIMMSHEDGLNVRDIITALRDDVKDVPEWVRRAGREELAPMIRDIIAQHEPEDDDGSNPDEFDAQAQDDLEAGDLG